MKKTFSKAFLLHLFLWITIPTIIRSLSLSYHIDLAFGPGQVALLKGLISGFFQDIFIALEIYVFFGLIGLFCARKHRMSQWILFTLSSLLFSLYNICLLIDLFLILNLGIRINSVFFYFINEIAPFVDSATSLGMYQFLTLALLIAGVSVIVFHNYFKHFQSPNLDIKSVAIAIAIFVIATLLYVVPPYSVKYYASNPIFAHQYDLMAKSLVQSHSDPSQVSKSDILSILPGNETEEFSLVSHEFPLLKMTNGFKGPKHFHIPVNKGERPHLIFLFLESFRAQDVGVLGSQMGATPVFDELKKEGVLFTNFYSTGVQTSHSVISSLFGIMPRFTEKSVQSDDPELPLIGIADLLNRREYLSAYVHNGSLEFQGKTAFFSHHGYSEIYGREDIIDKFPHAKRTTWGLHDEYLMRFVTDWMAQKDKEGQPTFLTLFTVSLHHPYRVPSYYKPPDFNVNKDSTFLPFFKDTAKQLYTRYLETMHYADYCLGLFVRLLKANGLYRKSIIFILADNSTPMGEHRRNFFALRYLYEENLKIPLLILAPGRLRAPAVVNELGSQVDLLPTIMDIFRINGLNHAIGASLAREVHARKVFFNNPFELGYRGLRERSVKFIYSKQEKGIIAELYNLESDPAEKKNLVTGYNSVKRYCEEAEKVQKVFNSLYHRRSFAPPIEYMAGIPKCK